MGTSTTTTTTTTEEPTTTIDINGTTIIPPYIQVQQSVQQQQIVKKPAKIPLLKRPPPIFDPEPEEIRPSVEQLVHAATEENKNNALLHVLGLEATGSTNINDALLQALTLVEDVKKAEKLPANVQPTIVFLTDGEPTVGVTSNSEIKKNIKSKNQEISVPIFGLGELSNFL